MNLYSILGYPGYKIDECGNVYSHKGGGLRHLQLFIINGYYHVSLRQHGRTHIKQVHRLMGTLYLNCPKNKEINHKDGNKLNNNLQNLEIGDVVKYIPPINKNLSISKRRALIEDVTNLKNFTDYTTLDCLDLLRRDK